MRGLRLRLRQRKRLQAAREKVEDPTVATDAAKLTAAFAEMEAAQEEADETLCAVGGADGEGWVVIALVLYDCAVLHDEI